MHKPDHVAIIGAGIVGVSTAIWLLRAGLKVTLVDRQPPGEGTSWGNAGILACSSVAPVTAPGMIAKAPRMLLGPNFPLFLRWAYLPKLAPWLIKYLSHANVADTRRIAQGLAPLVTDSVEQHSALAAGTEAAKWMNRSTYAFAYPDRAAFEKDAFTWALRREAGFGPELIAGQGVRDYEPQLGDGIQLLAVLRDHGFIASPGAYVKDLAGEVEKLGGTILQAELRDMSFADGKVSGLILDTGPLPCDRVVLATGVWSKPLTEKLGIKVPLESERGYHIVFEPSGDTLRGPIMVTTGKFIATPMAAGLRCAGVVEFGGLVAGPNEKAFALIERQVRSTFPGMNLVVKETWLGHRPAPTDSLPLIGEVSGTGVFTGFGHHHVGLTSGPKTGRMIADMITGTRTNLDLSVYAPGRFSS